MSSSRWVFAQTSIERWTKLWVAEIVSRVLGHLGQRPLRCHQYLAHLAECGLKPKTWHGQHRWSAESLPRVLVNTLLVTGLGDTTFIGPSTASVRAACNKRPTTSSTWIQGIH